MNSWRDTTKKQYKCYIKKWFAYVNARNMNSDSLSVADILDFLAQLYEDGLGYSTLNTARSALSTFISFHNKPVGSHPLVIRFMKGVFELRPSLPRHSTIWDVSIVLKFLELWYPPEELNMKHLTWKLVSLLLLATAQRCQTLNVLNLDNMTITDTSVSFRIVSLIKQSGPCRKQPNVSIPKIENEKLCVYRTLLCYIDRTKEYRSSSVLLLGLIKPYKPVAKSTIGKWVKYTLQQAGINTAVFGPHSTRAASTSKAVTSRVSLDTILNTAGWSNAKTFCKYYKKNIDTVDQKDSFACRVLNSNSS